MKTWLNRIYFMLSVIFPLAALVVIPPWHAKISCLDNLITIDHCINCPATVAMEREEGNIDSDGNWITNSWIAQLSEDDLCCPRSGEKFVVSLVVGKHPHCPTHGHLIEESGYVSHKSGPKGDGLATVMLGLLLSATIVPSSAIIVLGLRFIRGRKRRHNKRMHGTK